MAFICSVEPLNVEMFGLTVTDELASKESKKKKQFSILLFFCQKTKNGKFSIFLYLHKKTLGDFFSSVMYSADEMPEKCLQRCSQMMRLCLHNNEISDPGLIVRVLMYLHVATIKAGLTT